MWWTSNIPTSDKYNLALEKEVMWIHHGTRARMKRWWKSNTELLIEELQAVKAEFGEIIYPQLIEEEEK